MLHFRRPAHAPPRERCERRLKLLPFLTRLLVSVQFIPIDGLEPKPLIQRLPLQKSPRQKISSPTDLRNPKPHRMTSEPTPFRRPSGRVNKIFKTLCHSTEHPIDNNAEKVTSVWSIHMFCTAGQKLVQTRKVLANSRGSPSSHHEASTSPCPSYGLPVP